jgi:hypothetical protein
MMMGWDGGCREHGMEGAESRGWRVQTAEDRGCREQGMEGSESRGWRLQRTGD